MRDWRVIRGSDAPAVEHPTLRAGLLCAELDGVDLRNVRVAGVALAGRIFAAVRDESWGTVGPVVTHRQIESSGTSFAVRFHAAHERGGLVFAWEGAIVGDPDGTLTWTMDGTSPVPIRYNRIGFCVLHPSECAGCSYRVDGADGPDAGTLPARIAPQPVIGGTPQPLIPPFRSIEIDVAPGISARFEFEGDLFETEDQRNWSDSSFKTYSTPLSLGVPHTLAAGARLRQRVRLTVTEPPQSRPSLSFGPPVGSLPRFGLVATSVASEGDKRQAWPRLARLGLDHLRIELDPQSHWEQALADIDVAAQALGCALEVVIRARAESSTQLHALAGCLARVRSRVDRVLVLDDQGSVVEDTAFIAVRDALTVAVSGAPLAVGSELWFADLNRSRLPRSAAIDGVFYSIAATVHADDDASVLETAAMHGETVRSARAMSRASDVFVGPITFRPQVWPFGKIESEDGVPFNVDPRQRALIAAAWTVCSLKSLAESGATAVTYFETVGAGGVIERSDGAAERSAAVYPVYHVLADYGEWRSGTVLATTSTAPRAVDALGVSVGGRVHALVANLTPAEQACEVTGLGDRAEVRVLDETTVALAMAEPDEFRARSVTRHTPDGVLDLVLGPYATAAVEARSADISNSQKGIR